ncbi:MAG: hypothetical protein ABSH26_06645 [Opitutaceae bacterium]|jgi:hypothetical protein
MNLVPKRRSSAGSAAARVLFTAAALAAIPAYADTPDAAKTHTLFMGADISVGTDRDLYPVTDVHGSSWVVDANGRSKLISAKEGPINIKITPSLKLTEVSATVEGFKSERGYTFENDPASRQARGLTQAADLNAGYQVAVNQAAAVSAGAVAASSMAINKLGANAQYAPPGASATANGILNSTAQALEASMNAPGSDLFYKDDRGNPTGFDALDVSFQISSERLLSNPYVVTVTRFHPKDGAPGLVQNLVYSKALNPIDAHVQNVHLLEGGFPLNFEPLDTQIHLYNRGEEVATSVSSRRVPLTREEAFEYVKMEYVGAHKGDTLPPAPAMGKLPADLPRLLADGKYRDTYYVKVSREGLADGLFLDPSCTKRAEDPYLQSVVKSIRFKPALEKGKPVDGIAPLKLGQLTI